ncbi:MAG TPA: hypothetical protein VGC69_14905 [Bordetella sp.]
MLTLLRFFSRWLNKANQTHDQIYLDKCPDIATLEARMRLLEAERSGW